MESEEYLNKHWKDYSKLNIDGFGDERYCVIKYGDLRAKEEAERIYDKHIIKDKSKNLVRFMNYSELKEQIEQETAKKILNVLQSEYETIPVENIIGTIIRLKREYGVE